MARYPTEKNLPDTFTVADRLSGTRYNVRCLGYDNQRINVLRYKATVADPDGDQRLNATMNYATLVKYYRYTS